MFNTDINTAFVTNRYFLGGSLETTVQITCRDAFPGNTTGIVSAESL